LVGLILAASPNALAQPYAILHHFGGGASDGRFPVTALLEGSDGALYGTTDWGGLHGVGTVYTLNKDSQTPFSSTSAASFSMDSMPTRR
jgi:uncharacterized repeat protein (TIGR03803 family)